MNEQDGRNLDHPRLNARLRGARYGAIYGRAFQESLDSVNLLTKQSSESMASAPFQVWLKRSAICLYSAERRKYRRDAFFRPVRLL